MAITQSPALKTCILDLDETLVHSWENPPFLDWYGIYTNPSIHRQFHPPNNPSLCYSFDIPDTPNTIWGLYRPHLSSFLQACQENFQQVLIWSAGVNRYVQEITHQMFQDSSFSIPRVIWSRNECARYQGHYHKPLNNLITYLNQKHYLPFTIELNSTVIVDDKNHTFVQNPQNGILIPQYHPGANRPNQIPTIGDLTDRSDQHLLTLQKWFQSPAVKTCTDIRLLDKSKIFV